MELLLFAKSILCSDVLAYFEISFVFVEEYDSRKEMNYRSLKIFDSLFLIRRKRYSMVWYKTLWS